MFNFNTSGGHDVLAEESNFYFFDRGHCYRATSENAIEFAGEPMMAQH